MARNKNDLLFNLTKIFFIEETKIRFLNIKTKSFKFIIQKGNLYIIFLNQIENERK